MSQGQFDELSLALGALIDGLWLRRAAGEVLPPELAIALVLRAAAAMLDEEQRARLQVADAPVDR